MFSFNPVRNQQRHKLVEWVAQILVGEEVNQIIFFQSKNAVFIELEYLSQTVVVFN